MKILAIDSSGMPASVAVLEDGLLTAEYTVHYQRTHSQTLLPMMDEVRTMLGLDLESVDAVAIAGGPGSFTGLRIGSATAKGIGMAIDRPLINVPTLEGMAYNFYGTDCIVAPMMDARRSQVFAGIYSFRDVAGSGDAACSGNAPGNGADPLEILMNQEPVDVKELCARLDSLAKELGRKVLLMGDGAVSYRSLIEENLTAVHSYAPAHLNEQKAGSVAARAMDLARVFGEEKMESAAQHRPVYLRVSQAERVRAEKENGKG